MTLRRTTGLRRLTDDEVSARDRARSGHTGTQAIATVEGLSLALESLGDGLGEKAKATALGIDADADDLGGFESDLIDSNVAAKAALESIARNLLSFTGALFVGWRRAGTGAVLRTIYARLMDLPISVKDFGAVGDGVAFDDESINAAFTIGGNIVMPMGQYKIRNRLLVTVDHTSFTMHSGATIVGNVWTYNGEQLPFGSAILVTGKHCSIRGAGMGASIIQLSGGTLANGITFLHTDGGYCGYLTVDGGKSFVTAVKDDTFMTGVSVLNASGPGPAPEGGNPSGLASKVIVECVESRNWSQYGMQAYGDQAQAEFVNCLVHDIGIAGQSLSVGCGIAITRGNRGVMVRGCTIEKNKESGILGTSAGLASYDITIAHNIIRDNGRWGISWTEESAFASVTAVGTSLLCFNSNTITGNGTGTYDNKGGIRVGTYDGVGLISDVNSTGNIIKSNTGFGWLVQTNDEATDRTSNVTIDDFVLNNSDGDIGIGTAVGTDVRWNTSKVGTVINNGNSRLQVGRALGQGINLASAETITLPKEGDVFILTGSTEVINITPEPGRSITLAFGGSIPIANTGNIALPNKFNGTGNATLPLVCAGFSWFPDGTQIGNPVADPTGGSVVDVEARATLAALLASLRGVNVIGIP